MRLLGLIIKGLRINGTQDTVVLTDSKHAFGPGTNRGNLIAQHAVFAGILVSRNNFEFQAGAFHHVNRRSRSFGDGAVIIDIAYRNLELEIG